jgi:hypothetical protein
MSSHKRADYLILIESASHYIQGHAAGAGIVIQPPVWDRGSDEILTGTHTVQIRSGDALEELRIPHEWLPFDSDGHGRFRTDVEAALARLKASAKTSDVEPK